MAFCNCLDAEIVQATDYDGANVRRIAEPRILFVDGPIWTARVAAALATAALFQQGPLDTKGKQKLHILCFYLKHYNKHL